jgi:phytoene desaturase
LSKSVIIIGAGFAGLSAASFMARAGWKVQVVEQNSTPGGRARQLQAEGFTFDMGPSWYWMPDVFERFFAQFGKKVSDYYTLTRLNPSYRVYWPEGHTDIPADYEALRQLFESIEPGSARQLDSYLKEAGDKYRIGMQSLVYKPGQSLTEFVDRQVLGNVFRLDLFTSIKKHVAKHFKSQKLQQLMEFPVLFLGALPADTPALYSLMNYADMRGGTWFPQGGMFSIVKAMHSLAVELGVEFRFNEEATEIVIEQGKARRLVTNKGSYTADAIISGGDYHFTEQHLLAPEYRSYTETYWQDRVLAPSCLLYYIGVNKKIDHLLHHSLFFDVPFQQHADEIYERPQWPTEPMFYLSATTKTDPSGAPPGGENLFLLIPVAAGLKEDTEAVRERYFNETMARLEMRLGQSIRKHITYKRSFSVSDFEREYHSFKGNAYGLANTLMQTAIFKPSCRSKKVPNLYYTGQFTVPGPGVPPSLISGEVVSAQVVRQLG